MRVARSPSTCNLPLLFILAFGFLGVGDSRHTRSAVKTRGGGGVDVPGVTRRPPNPLPTSASVPAPPTAPNNAADTPPAADAADADDELSSLSAVIHAADTSAETAAGTALVFSDDDDNTPVSYTHLTLPTICSV